MAFIAPVTSQIMKQKHPCPISVVVKADMRPNYPHGGHLITFWHLGPNWRRRQGSTCTTVQLNIQGKMCVRSYAT